MAKDGIVSIKADQIYFEKSLREPTAHLVISEREETKGKPYLPIMPPYTQEVVSDAGAESLWHYLRTLADEGQRGPEKVMVEREVTTAPSKLIDIPGEEIVTDRTRVMRGPLPNTSGRQCMSVSPMV